MLASRDDNYSGTRQAVLILRLVLDHQAQLRYGELLDAQANRQARFVDVAGLTSALSQWLSRQEREECSHLGQRT